MNDIILRRARRHLETLQLPVPLPEVMEEIFRFIEDSNIYYSIKRHLEIVDREVREALGGTVADTHDYDAGYTAALDDITELGNTAADNNGPTAA